MIMPENWKAKISKSVHECLKNREATDISIIHATIVLHIKLVGADAFQRI